MEQTGKSQIHNGPNWTEAKSNKANVRPSQIHDGPNWTEAKSNTAKWTKLDHTKFKLGPSHFQTGPSQSQHEVDQHGPKQIHNGQSRVQSRQDQTGENVTGPDWTKSTHGANWTKPNPQWTKLDRSQIQQSKRTGPNQIQTGPKRKQIWTKPILTQSGPAWAQIPNQADWSRQRDLLELPPSYPKSTIPNPTQTGADKTQIDHLKFNTDWTRHRKLLELPSSSLRRGHDAPGQYIR